MTGLRSIGTLVSRTGGGRPSADHIVQSMTAGAQFRVRWDRMRWIDLEGLADDFLAD